MVDLQSRRGVKQSFSLWLITWMSLGEENAKVLSNAQLLCINEGLVTLGLTMPTCLQTFKSSQF